jgi:hypothetical protein
MLPAFLCAMLRAWEPIAEVGSWYLIHSIPAVLQTAHTLKPVSQAKARAMLPRALRADDSRAPVRHPMHWLATFAATLTATRPDPRLGP